MTCPRVWEVDAVSDGRLPAKEVERHWRGCAECRARAAMNENLRELMRALASETPEPGELRLRRLRGRVLRDASMPREPRVFRRAALAVVLPAGIIAALVVVGLELRSSPKHAAGPPPHEQPSPSPQPSGTNATAAEPAASDAPSTSAVVFAGTVTPTPGARWLQARDGGTERVSLLTGEIRVHVRPQEADERFLVEVPDGAIEVRGTTFDVIVRDGATRRVRVVEGVVLLSLRGRAQTTLTSGQSWDAPLSRTFAPPNPPPPDDGLSEYEAATRLYGEGKFEGAADAFRRFSLAHPEAGTTDDAMFLQAVSLARAGHVDAAGLAAARQMARFPRSVHGKDAAILVARAARARNDCDAARTALAPWLNESDAAATRELGLCAASPESRTQ